MNSYNNLAKLFGIFFIITFLSYGVGSALIDSIVNVFENKTQLLIGAILMGIVHTFVNVGVPVIVFPILKPYSLRLSLMYLILAVITSIILVIGTIFLLLLLPLSDINQNVDSLVTCNIEILNTIVKKGAFFSYQLAMAIWSLGGLIFTYLLYKSKIVPRLLAVWGFIGYLFLITGTICELFSQEIGLALSIPGGLFEISLSIWVIFKGFGDSNESLV